MGCNRIPSQLAINQNFFCGTYVVPPSPRTMGICGTYVVLPTVERLLTGFVLVQEN